MLFIFLRRQVQCKVHILYDITEWYPSKKNLRGLNILKRFSKFLFLTAISLYSSLFVSAFIFGEHYKAKPFRFLFFWKKYIYLPYYACVPDITCYPVKDLRKECTLFYAGSLTAEKGFYNVLNVASECARQMPDTKFILQIISPNPLPRNITAHNYSLLITPQLPFEEFITEIGKADIFLDLRKIDFENNRCLPIKLFYYIAAARPVIYSNLKAIRKEVPDIADFGTLINPINTITATTIVKNYINNYELYKTHCDNARKTAEQKYNWIFYEKLFVNFIREL